MVLEKILLNDGREVEVNVRFLNTRRAFSIFQKSIEIENIKVSKQLDPKTGESVDVPNIQGKFTGLLSMSWDAFDECVADFPEKDDVSPDEVTRIYEKYAKPILDKLLVGTISPQRKGK